MAKNLLARRVLYTDGQGYQKAALVLGTHESVQAGTAVTQPAEGNVNLRVFSPTGDPSKDYFRTNIAQGSGKRQFELRG